MLKKIGEFFRSLSYMTAAVLLFLAAFGLTVFVFVRAVTTGGNIGRLESALCLLSLIFAAAGVVIPLYGHFIVRVDGKADWRVGVAMNGLLLLALIFLYFLGI
ncbi:MAG: hypothetical protein IJL47_04295 [Lachnospiraceae bacterium]|nr:hypothetical protein [Lachnospiraceae bacterium]